MPPIQFPTCGSLLCISILFAFQCSSIPAPVRLTLAVPPNTASLSLGVFNQSGRLIRTLATCEPIENLPLGVNGPQISWDGLDENQIPAPAGKYLVAGFAIPESTRVSSVSTLFNTLLSDSGTPLARSILAICDFDPPQLLVQLPSSEEVALIFLDEDGYPSTYHSLCEDEIPLASSPSAKILQRDGLLVLHCDSSLGAPLPILVNSTVSIAGLAEFWAVVNQQDQKLIVGTLEDGQILYKTTIPVSASCLAPLKDGSVIVSDTHSLWRINENSSQAIPLPDVLEIFDLAAGPENTFWLAGKKSSPPEKSSLPSIRQYSADGKLLRELSISQNCELIRLFGDPLSLRLGIVTSSSEAWHAFAILAPPTAPAIPSETNETRIVSWTTTFDHRIEFVDKPCFQNATPSPRGCNDFTPASFQLASNEFGPATQVKLIVRRKASGAWLATSQGLDILYLMECSGPPAWHKSSDDKLSVLVPVSGAAYLAVVPNLTKLIPISGGEIVWEK